MPNYDIARARSNIDAALRRLEMSVTTDTLNLFDLYTDELIELSIRLRKALRASQKGLSHDPIPSETASPTTPTN